MSPASFPSEKETALWDPSLNLEDIDVDSFFQEPVIAENYNLAFDPQVSRDELWSQYDGYSGPGSAEQARPPQDAQVADLAGIPYGIPDRTSTFPFRYQITSPHQNTELLNGQNLHETNINPRNAHLNVHPLVNPEAAYFQQAQLTPTFAAPYQVPYREGTPSLASEPSTVTAPHPASPSGQGASKFPCPDCAKRFNKSNDLKRHVQTKHTSDGPYFMCKCGYSNTRKDNYKRHVLTCKNDESDVSYACICSHVSSSKERHLVHIVPCNVGFHGKAGRPRSQTVAADHSGYLELSYLLE
ncbi:hypothetical protein TruAng_004741 [Truncatella angustata]|nr:hypothetical protein TruAng_004741 [Truncatella angustata]